ncbi:hypothetical protein Clacol_008877 [Clathrus columnatus]|uniref:Uncharacterized protein n=1 Tax=Clathrus columnatus TaxID=1419009 RepID=A0AAV5AIY7_9AGAM|nr:hypothetical protein Clacol_008877 [Clathrus columnatus]
MATIHSVKRANSHLAWDNSIPPVLTINSGDIINFDCLDASNGQITPSSTTETLSQLVFSQLDQVNGPVYVTEATPGDTLEVEIISIQTADWGWTGIIPGFGLLSDEYPTPNLKIWKIDTENAVAWFNDSICIPIKPFAGEMGVAPGEPGAHSTIPPYKTGGNIDTKHLTVGAKLYLPVEVPGALFSIGDGHAAQGDGEICGTAIETPIRVQVRLTVLKNKSYVKTPHFHTPPVNITEEKYYTTTGVGPDIREAARDAARFMIQYLQTEHTLTRDEAYMLCSVAGDLRLHEVTLLESQADLKLVFDYLESLVALWNYTTRVTGYYSIPNQRGLDLNQNSSKLSLTHFKCTVSPMLVHEVTRYHFLPLRPPFSGLAEIIIKRLTSSLPDSIPPDPESLITTTKSPWEQGRTGFVKWTVYCFGAVGVIYSYVLSAAGKANVTCIARGNYEATKGKTVANATDRPYSHVIVATKALPEIAPLSSLLAPLLQKERELPVFVLLQNGLGVERDFYNDVKQLRNESPKIITTAFWIGSNLLDGNIIEHSHPERLVIGMYRPTFPPDVVNSPEETKILEDFSDLLKGFDSPVRIVDEIQRIKFEKNFWNATFGVCSALTRYALPAFFREEVVEHQVTPQIRGMMQEVLAIGRAMGFSEEALPSSIIDSAITSVVKLHKSPDSIHKASTLLDVEKGRPMELEVLLGELIRKAKELGVDAPRLELVYSLLFVVQHQLVRSQL